MAISFNLIDKPWIPCIRLRGNHEELSLRDVFAQADQLREIRGDSPLETASLHRLLLAVLHRVFRPKGWTAWNKLWRSRQFDTSQIDGYLDRREIHPRFDLFDPKRPFYQSRELQAGEKSVISLVLEMASGNNATLFDHHTEDGDVALTPAQAARALITSQAFGIGGTNPPTGNFTDAPCAKGIIFLASGDNVFETLMLNLVRYGGEDPIPNCPDDSPAWEQDDPLEPGRTKPKGYLDYLTWHNRRIWLFPEETTSGALVKRMCWASGLRLDANDIDPMKQYVADKDEGWRPLSFKSDRALWRDSATLFRLSDGNRPPIVMQWIANLVQQGIIETRRQYGLMALGMAKGKPKTANLNFFRAETLPLRPVFLNNEDHLGNLSAALESAEKVREILYSATFILARLIVDPSLKDADVDSAPKKEEREHVKPLANSWGTERYFWSGLELHFHRLAQDLPTDPQAALQAWHNQLRHAARAAFNQAEAYVGADRRTLRAIVKARDHFEYDLKYILQEPDETQSEKEVKNNGRK